MTDRELTAYDRAVRWCKNQPLIVALLLLVAILAGLRTFSDVLDRFIPLQGPSSSERGTPKSPTEVAQPSALFSPVSLLPVGYSLVLPGGRLSLVRATYPSGEFGHVHGEPFFEVLIPAGPFHQVLYYYSQADSAADPEILFVTFLLRREEFSAQVSREALQRYGSSQAKSFVDGRLLWENVGGLRIAFQPRRSLEYAQAQ